MRYDSQVLVWGKTDAPLSSQQLLLRGCKLRNTEWALGLVVYTGKETKIQMVREMNDQHKDEEKKKNEEEKTRKKKKKEARSEKACGGVSGSSCSCQDLSRFFSTSLFSEYTRR